MTTQSLSVRIGLTEILSSNISLDTGRGGYYDETLTVTYNSLLLPRKNTPVSFTYEGITHDGFLINTVEEDIPSETVTVTAKRFIDYNTVLPQVVNYIRNNLATDLADDELFMFLDEMYTERVIEEDGTDAFVKTFIDFLIVQVGASNSYNRLVSELQKYGFDLILERDGVRLLPIYHTNQNWNIPINDLTQSPASRIKYRDTKSYANRIRELVFKHNVYPSYNNLDNTPPVIFPLVDNYETYETKESDEDPLMHIRAAMALSLPASLNRELFREELKVEYKLDIGIQPGDSLSIVNNNIFPTDDYMIRAVEFDFSNRRSILTLNPLVLPEEAGIYARTTRQLATPLTPVMGNPNNLIEKTGDTIQVQWNHPEDSPLIEGYLFYISVRDRTGMEIITRRQSGNMNTEKNNYFHYGLTAGYQYRYELVSFNQYQESEPLDMGWIETDEIMPQSFFQCNTFSGLGAILTSRNITPEFPQLAERIGETVNLEDQYDDVKEFTVDSTTVVDRFFVTDPDTGLVNVTGGESDAFLTTFGFTGQRLTANAARLSRNFLTFSSQFAVGRAYVLVDVPGFAFRQGGIFRVFPFSGSLLADGVFRRESFTSLSGASRFLNGLRLDLSTLPANLGAGNRFAGAVNRILQGYDKISSLPAAIPGVSRLAPLLRVWGLLRYPIGLGTGPIGLLASFIPDVVFGVLEQLQINRRLRDEPQGILVDFLGDGNGYEILDTQIQVRISNDVNLQITPPATEVPAPTWKSGPYNYTFRVRPTGAPNYDITLMFAADNNDRTWRDMDFQLAEQDVEFQLNPNVVFIDPQTLGIDVHQWVRYLFDEENISVDDAKKLGNQNFFIKAVPNELTPTLIPFIGYDVIPNRGVYWQMRGRMQIQYIVYENGVETINEPRWTGWLESPLMLMDEYVYPDSGNNRNTESGKYLFAREETP